MVGRYESHQSSCMHSAGLSHTAPVYKPFLKSLSYCATQSLVGGAANAKGSVADQVSSFSGNRPPVGMGGRDRIKRRARVTERGGGRLSGGGGGTAWKKKSG